MNEHAATYCRALSPWPVHGLGGNGPAGAGEDSVDAGL